MDASLLLTLHTAHTSSCGEPPHFTARTGRAQYDGEFENEHGE
jgi:hypothetical protein